MLEGQCAALWLGLLLVGSVGGQSQAELSSPPEWAWSARMAGCALSLSATPGEIEALAEGLKRDGYSVVTVHPGVLSYDVLGYDNADHYPPVRAFVAACHERGIRVVLKAMTLWHNKQQAPQYQGTAGRRADGSLTSYHLPPRPGARAWYSCLNHPAIREAHLQKLPRLLAATGMDGFMTDALIRPDMYSCVCEHCREKFRRDTGFEVPMSADAPFWGNHEDAAYRAWLLWRFRSVTEFLGEVNRALRGMNPQRYLIEYYAPGIPSMLTSATDHEVLADAGACMIGQEIGVGPASQYNWRHILAKLRHAQSLCHHRGRAPFAIFHNTHAYSCPHFFRGLAWSCGLRKWEYPNAYGAIRGVLVSERARLWDRLHEDVLVRTQSPATVAIVYSRNSYVLVKAAKRGVGGDRDPGDGEYFGWAEFLIESNIPYHSLVDSDLTGETLSGYRVLILPNIACMSPAAARAIRQFVAGGGRLIATAQTSLYSADGQRLAGLQLGDLLGLKAQEAVTPETPVEMVSSHFGEGEVVYFPGSPGKDVAQIANYLGSRGGQWTRPAGEACMSVMRKALGEELGAPLRPVAVPRGVVASLLQPDVEATGRRRLHLLNLQCTEIEPDGAEIPKGCEVTYPHVEGPIVVDVQAPWPCHAYAVSPDFESRRPISAHRTRDYVRLTVPGLVRSSLVCVEPGEAPDAGGTAPATPVQRPFERDASVSLTGSWQACGIVDRPIGSRSCRTQEYVLPAGIPFRMGDSVQLDMPIGEQEGDGLELRYWEADLCTHEIGGRGRLVKLLLVNGTEVARQEMLGDGSWVARRCRMSDPVDRDRQRVLSLRVEAVRDGTLESDLRVWWADAELWRDGLRLRSLSLPAVRQAG